MRFSVDEAKCTLCGACILTCPTDMVREKRGAIKISRVACIGCGHCMAICPAGAVALEEIDYEGDFRPAADSRVDADALLGLMKSRRTVRTYRPEPLTEEQLGALLEAARYAPTAANCQCQEFTVVKGAEARAQLVGGIMAYYREYAEVLADREHPERLEAFQTGSGEMHEHILAAVPALVKNVEAGRDRLFFDAPTVIIIHADESEVLPEAACAFAALQTCLMAEALGLGSCITAYASLALQALPGLRARTGIPEGHQVYYVITVGQTDERYPLIPPRRPARVRVV